MTDANHGRALMIESLFERGSLEHENLDARRRRQLLREIAKGGNTRKRLAISLKMRAGTVTRHVAELCVSGLVVEVHEKRTNGKGRPETLLALNASFFMVGVVRALSDKLYGNLIDLAGTVHYETSRTVDAGRITAGQMREIIADIAHELEAHVGSSQLAGVVVSLPGIVDETADTWLFSSRFPKAAPLTGESIQQALDVPVSLQRALNAELRARLLQRPHLAAETTIMLHWGYGIGLAYASNGEVISSTRGAFGEVGHWRSGDADQKICRCGERGCLETSAALWALGEALELSTVSEYAFGQMLEVDDNLATHPLVTRATSLVALALRDVYLLLVPNRIIITGPFIQSRTIIDRLTESFRRSLPHFIPDKVEIDAAALNFDDEMIGAAKPLLHRCVQQRLH